jgi:hypothetical protein
MGMGDHSTSTFACTSGEYASSAYCTAWLDGAGLTNSHFGDELDVQDVVIEDGVATIYFTNLPSYTVEITEEIIASLEGREYFAEDFPEGVLVSVGDVVEFGDDIGYAQSDACDACGWLPPHLLDAADQSDYSSPFSIPLTPEPKTGTCFTATGTIGKFINGASIFGWGDDASYNSAGSWYNVAQKLEVRDLDICLGHAAGDPADYHHHGDPVCLRSEVGDNGSAKSPILGFLNDGYPILGPYYAADTPYQSCWIPRDYSDTALGGCEGGGRTCKLVDQYDLSQGTYADGVEAGPGTDEYVTSLSGNNFLAVSGTYYEDYYYSSECTAQGDEYLDQYNGRWDDEYGYVYAHTGEAFPFNIGPEYYGDIGDNANCLSAYVEESSSGGSGGGEAPTGESPAVTACEGLEVGDACTYSSPNGETTGTCGAGSTGLSDFDHGCV